MNDSVIGLDIAKQIFHLVKVNKFGKKELKKKLRRTELLKYFINLPPCKIAMESCASSQHWAREFEKQGHQVVLLPAQHVKAFVRGNKNDYNDALAIAEASRFNEIRPVAIKTGEQQSIQAIHRLRRGAVGDRTALCNQVKGLLSEFGIIINQGIAPLRKSIPSILEDGENELDSSFRIALDLKYTQLTQLDKLVTDLDKIIQDYAKEHSEIRRLQTIPGFGPVISSNYYSAIGDGKAFKNGRGVSASIGIVPKQHSSGGKHVLLGISKRGDKYLRSLLIHGARSVVRLAANKEDHLSCWINRLVERRGKNKATVALANKLARIAWAVTTTGKAYEASYMDTQMITP